MSNNQVLPELSETLPRHSHYVCNLVSSSALVTLTVFVMFLTLNSLDTARLRL